MVLEVSVELMKVLHLELALENYLEPVNLLLPVNLLAKSKVLEMLIDLVTPLVKVLEMELNLVVLQSESAMDYVDWLDAPELLKLLDLGAVSKLESQLMTA